MQPRSARGRSSRSGKRAVVSCLGASAIRRSPHGGQRHRNNAEEDPRPGLAVDQPALQAPERSSQGRRRLPSQTRPAGSAAASADRRERGSPGRRRATCRRQKPCITRSATSRSSRSVMAARPHAAPMTSVAPMTRRRGSTRVISQGAVMNPMSFDVGVADVQPGELVGRRMDVADDIAAPERQHGAGDRLGQRGKHNARERSAVPRQPVASPPRRRQSWS